MINFVTHNDGDELEEELPEDEDATLADDLLDDVGGDETDTEDDLMEGFGILPESDTDDEEEDDEDSLEEDEDLEEDAEDVDFDRFDDVDEM